MWVELLRIEVSNPGLDTVNTHCGAVSIRLLTQFEVKQFQTSSVLNKLQSGMITFVKPVPEFSFQ